MRVDFPDPNPGIMLYPNVFLKSVGAGLKLNPTQVLGSVLVKAIQIYEIEGRVLVAFPSEDQPLTLKPGDFEGLSDHDYKHTYKSFTLAASGSASLKIPVLNETFRLGGAFFVYTAPSYVHVGGDVEQRFGGVITLKGRTSGEFNLNNKRFNFGQDIEACVADFICRRSYTRISSVGIGACATVGIEDVGWRSASAAACASIRSKSSSMRMAAVGRGSRTWRCSRARRRRRRPAARSR